MLAASWTAPTLDRERTKVHAFSPRGSGCRRAARAGGTFACGVLNVPRDWPSPGHSGLALRRTSNSLGEPRSSHEPGAVEAHPCCTATIRWPTLRAAPVLGDDSAGKLVVVCPASRRRSDCFSPKTSSRLSYGGNARRNPEPLSSGRGIRCCSLRS